MICKGGEIELEEKDTELMEVSSQEEFLKNYKAFYHAMTAKPDCKSKAYPRNVVVEIDDIFDLNSRIFEKFKNQYENIGASCNIFVSLKGREKLEFPNWKSFEEHTWTETSTITGMIMVWEFNVKLPRYQVPQRHTLTVKVSNGMRPEEMISLMISGKLEEVEEIDQNICPVVAKIDFVDVVIGNEVLGIVSEWVKGLKSSDSDKGKMMMFMQRHKRKVAYLIKYFTLFCSIICGIKIVNALFTNFSVDTFGELKIVQVSSILNAIVFCGLACFVVCKLTGVFAQYVFKILAEYGGEHIFCLTKGDRNEQERYRKEQQKDKKKVCLNFCVTIFINIVCGILTYFITKGM